MTMLSTTGSLHCRHWMMTRAVKQYVHVNSENITWLPIIVYVGPLTVCIWSRTTYESVSDLCYIRARNWICVTSSWWSECLLVRCRLFITVPPKQQALALKGLCFHEQTICVPDLQVHSQDTCSTLMSNDFKIVCFFFILSSIFAYPCLSTTTQ